VRMRGRAGYKVSHSCTRTLGFCGQGKLPYLPPAGQAPGVAHSPEPPEDQLTDGHACFTSQ